MRAGCRCSVAAPRLSDRDSSATVGRTFAAAGEFAQAAERRGSPASVQKACGLLLREEVFGFSFALACDFLKENGYPEFVKPDTHINDIARALKITTAQTDFGVFKDVIACCKRNGLVPYEFDKLLWLVGSGSFYLNNLKVRTEKRRFIESIVGRK